MTDTIHVPMAGLEVAKNKGQLVTVVGSCIAIMLYDVKYRIGGMVHIMLGFADGRTDNPAKYADTGLSLLIQTMVAEGAAPHRLVGAKIAGGGKMFSVGGKNLNVSANNISAVHQVLDQRQITIIGSDTGGTRGRKVIMDVATGEVRVLVQNVAE